ncbi:hypothetical protein D9613_010742 [Agrocybe pediades]|uniref:F-box domain-containing protein n=1 Tax=Agrocybe pediades TaxID=84607 RepID=A0A8H4QLC0_9AGAR|nr:hypothetical protein D9613_010742 [Agrocybe pediades]
MPASSQILAIPPSNMAHIMALGDDVLRHILLFNAVDASVSNSCRLSTAKASSHSARWTEELLERSKASHSLWLECDINLDCDGRHQSGRGTVTSAGEVTADLCLRLDRILLEHWERLEILIIECCTYDLPPATHHAICSRFFEPAPRLRVFFVKEIHPTSDIVRHPLQDFPSSALFSDVAPFLHTFGYLTMIPIPFPVTAWLQQVKSLTFRPHTLAHLMDITRSMTNLQRLCLAPVINFNEACNLDDLAAASPLLLPRLQMIDTAIQSSAFQELHSRAARSPVTNTFTNLQIVMAPAVDYECEADVTRFKNTLLYLSYHNGILEEITSGDDVTCLLSLRSPGTIKFQLLSQVSGRVFKLAFLLPSILLGRRWRVARFLLKSLVPFIKPVTKICLDIAQDADLARPTEKPTEVIIKVVRAPILSRTSLDAYNSMERQVPAEESANGRKRDPLPRLMFPNLQALDFAHMTGSRHPATQSLEAFVKRRHDLASPLEAIHIPEVDRHIYEGGPLELACGAYRPAVNVEFFVPAHIHYIR